MRRPISDAKLIEMCLDGDVEAWSLLLERYQGLIVGLARRSGLNSSDAEDVFQNVSIMLYTHLADLRDSERIGGWLGTTTRHEISRLFRRSSTALVNTTDAAPEELEAGTPIHAGAESTPENEVIELEKRVFVREAMGELGEECRNLIAMLYKSEEPPSYSDIAKQLRVPVGSIGPKRARCIDKLRKLLELAGYG